MLKKIELTDFKIHKKLKLNFNKKINLLYGDNNIGKTSVLEAINLFNAQNKAQHLDSYSDNNFFQISLHSIYDYKIIFNGIKSIYINNNSKKNINLLEYIQIYYLRPYIVQLFWHDQCLRRKIIDKIIAQNNILFLKAYSEYQQILKQRNHLIENNLFNNYWKTSLDNLLKKNALFINEFRKKQIDKINLAAKEKNLKINITFSPNFDEQNLILQKDLSNNFQGVHKTKFNITNNDAFLSNSQQHITLIELYTLAFNENIIDKILLLDDIFACLDINSINRILDLLDQNDFQTIITHTKPISHLAIENIELSKFML